MQALLLARVIRQYGRLKPTKLIYREKKAGVKPTMR
eukprot:UN03588